MTLIEILRKRAECEAMKPDLPRLQIGDMKLSFDDAGRFWVEFENATDCFKATAEEAAQITNWFVDLASSPIAGVAVRV